MNHKYFVSYQFTITMDSGGWGFGNSVIETALPIATSYDIQLITNDLLKKNTSYKQVIIMNWIKLG